MRACAILAILVLAGCQMFQNDGKKPAGRFDEDVAFLKQHGQVVVLKSGDARVAVMPSLQGRVMTSSTGADDSFGWINRTYFAEVRAGKINPHINPYGGEDRFWIGPEGGQFSIFFKAGDPFDFAHWKTPEYIDTEPFDLVSKSSDSATFRRTVSFENYSKTKFDVQIDRTVRMLTPDDAWKRLGVSSMNDVKLVAFETDNRVTNTGAAQWKKSSGLLSIWILGMLNATDQTTVVVPVKGGQQIQAPMINDDYFGKVSADRLRVKGNTVFFKADAHKRGKIGTPVARTTNRLGSYDAVNHVLTIAQFTLNESAHEYVNSAWKLQDNPFGGDIANSYNDGPNDTGTQMGSFYELETSSAAYELKSRESVQHVHRTIHLSGDEKQLDAISRAVLGVGLDEIRAAFTN